jgi:hypothetical protein
MEKLLLIKKEKKMKMKRLLTVLLSLAIMVTFMPMMAFANAPAKTKATFNSDYSKVTVAAYKDTVTEDSIPEHTYNTVRVYNEDGTISAYPDPATDVDWEVPSGPDVTAKYYDMSVAEFADEDGKTLKAEYAWGRYTQGSMEYLKLNVPSYVANKAEAQAVTANLYYMKDNWYGVAVGDEEFVGTKREAQSFTLSLEDHFTTAEDDGITFFGTVPAKEVTVAAPDPNPAYDTDYFFDSEEVKAAMGNKFGSGTAANPFVALYDGEAHTFMAREVSGWTAAYSVWDSSTGKWNATTAVTLTDVLDKPEYVKVEWTKTGETTQTRTFYVNLKNAGTAIVGFVPSEDGYYSVPGTTYDASSYIDAVAEVTYDKSLDDAPKAYAKLLDAATAKAVAANKAEILAYFNELNEIAESTSKSNPNIVELDIVSKDLTTAERTAIAKKYAKLLTRLSVMTGDDDAVVGLNGVDLTDYEIEFVEAPAKKVIKTKKAKSTKKVTINIKAECKNGTVVKYKLINAPKKNITIDANTGKITVKKGTPVGTYSMKIKAYIPGSYNYFGTNSFSETQDIKVIVKKTKKK